MITEKQAKEFAKLYSHSINSVENQGGSHNHVYVVKSDTEFILRISSIEHRTFNDTMGEIDFLRYLHNNGASVSYPLQGLNGEYVHEMEYDNNRLIITAFSCAKGLDWLNRGNDMEDKQWVIQIGKTIGRIHRLSKTYQPNKCPMRRQWYQSQHLSKAEQIFERYNPELSKVYLEYLNTIKRLHKDGACFGLIHGDFLFSNYNRDANDVVVYDFDECEYSWYIYDIAVCMYYYLLGGAPSELSGKKEEAQEMLYLLLTGYLQENDMDVYWINNIDLFFQMRDFVLLSTILKDSTDDMGEWQESFVTGALDRQLNHKPFLEADYLKAYNRSIEADETLALRANGNNQSSHM